MHAYSHHIYFKLAAHTEQSLLKTASSDPKLAFMTAAVSSLQQRGVAGLRKGQATLRSAFPVADVIGAGAKNAGSGGVTDYGFGQGKPA